MDATDLMREAEIRALDLIGQPVPDVFGHLVAAAAHAAGTAGARINVITSTTQHTLASYSDGRDGCDNKTSLCSKIVREVERNHIVPDARLDARFADSAFVTSGVVRSYAASQLVTANGVPIGTLCVYDPGDVQVDAQKLAVVADLAAAAMEVLESRRMAEVMREAIEELADGSRELRRSNEHLAAFAGQVSHDVQGPLAAVLMALQLLEEEQYDETDESAFLVRSALSGAQRMRATVSGLMDFAVLGGRLAPARLDMESIVADVLVDLTARMGRAEIVVGDLPKVWGDDVQIRAVTQNLIANALKYAGGVTRPVIHVSGATSDGRTRVSVSDNGPGVPEAERESVFGLMVRGDGIEQTGVDGLGIGLATCRRIVNAHHGTIGVSTSAAGGAEFWFELPTEDARV